MKQQSLLIAMCMISALLCPCAVSAALMGQAISQRLSYIWFFTFSILVTLWVHADARSRGKNPPLDFGFLFFAAWVLALPCYLISTRGIKGFAGSLGLFAVYQAPFVLSWSVFAFS